LHSTADSESTDWRGCFRLGEPNHMRISKLTRSITWPAFSMLLLGACSTSHPQTTSAPAAAPYKDSILTDSRSNSWAPQITTGKWRYFIRDSSTVSLSNDTTSHVLPIKAAMLYSVSIDDSAGSLILTARVESLSISTPQSVKTNAPTSRLLELRIALAQKDRLTGIAGKAETSCTGAGTSPLSRIGELIISFPATPVRVGEKWTDTSSTTTCHGKIPLVQLTTREYELLDLSSCQQRDAVKVRRVVSNTFTGASTESGNHLSASGSGTASSILCLQRDTGVLLESNGQSRLDLTVTTTRGIFPFTQNTNTHIELR
jgi:hypothetical protein